MNRRRFLSAAGAAGAASIFDPTSAFLRQTISGMVNQAVAAEAGLSPRRLLYLQLNGAPTRWMFDQILNPNNETMHNNGNVATHFTESGGRLVTPVYGNYQFGSWYLPYLWRFSVPKSSGGTRPMTDLLSNLLVMRGIDTGSPGHSDALLKQQQLPGNRTSLGGLVADRGGNLIPAVAFQVSNLVFKSEKSLNPIYIDRGENLAATLLNPFTDTTNATHKAKIQAHRVRMDKALGALDRSIASYGSGLALDRKNAEEMLRAGATDLAAQYPAIRNRYRNLITQTFAGSYVGLNDKPVGRSDVGARGNTYWFEENKPIQDADLRSLFYEYSDVDLLADSCALAEFTLVNNYSSTIAASINAVSNLRATLAGDTNQWRWFGWDQHFSGVVPVTFLNSMAFLATGACLLELIDRLKAKAVAPGKTLFDETVIQLSGEFNRSPRNDGSGSDHAFQAASVSVLSGAIKSFAIVGNVYSHDPAATTYQGSWGEGAKITLLGGVPAASGHMLSSLAKLLRVPSPAANSEALINVGTDGVTSLIGPAQTAPYGETT